MNIWHQINDFLDHHSLADKFITGTIGFIGTWLSVWFGFYFKHLPEINMLMSFLTALITVAFVSYRFFSTYKEHQHKKRMWEADEKRAGNFHKN
jgi:hypothetical protein